MSEAETAGCPSTDFLRLVHLPTRELERMLRAGETPDPEHLAGWEYRGWNAPPWAGIVGIRKFVKGFYRAPGTTGLPLFGYNLSAAPNRAEAVWKVKPRRFGFYRVDRSESPRHEQALLLDYSKGSDPRWMPTRTLRDYVVRAFRGSDDILLGKAYLELLGQRVFVSHFLLERGRPAP